LSKELSIAPKDIAFTYGPFGKPALAGGSEVSFNVSHSGEYALIAIGTCGAIGVDIEKVRPIADIERLADTVFSSVERAALARLPTSDRLEGFYSGWTRKEAYIKARGDGFSRPLADFDVTIGPREPAYLTRVAGEPHETERWTLSALSPVRGCAAAICVEGRDCSLLCNW
jgi:4'-phosphopantetheinyl transferase